MQRLGPSTGLPTRTAQGDILSTAVLSHGDTKHIMLIPSSAEECYAFTMQAFDLAERFQTPVFVMTDLDLGMNTWMSDSFRVSRTSPSIAASASTRPTLARLGDWGRYVDVDGDGIAWRTVPGDGLPAYFNRGSGHNAKGQYSERADDYTANVDRLAKKFETARKWVPAEVADEQPGADDRHRRLRHEPLGDGRSARPAEERGGPDDVVHAAARRTRSRRRSSSSSTGTSGSTSSSRTAMRRCSAC